MALSQKVLELLRTILAQHYYTWRQVVHICKFRQFDAVRLELMALRAIFWLAEELTEVILAFAESPPRRHSFLPNTVKVTKFTKFSWRAHETLMTA